MKLYPMPTDDMIRTNVIDAVEEAETYFDLQFPSQEKRAEFIDEVTSYIIWLRDDHATFEDTELRFYYDNIIMDAARDHGYMEESEEEDE